MYENKKMEISLGTAVSLFIILILVFVIIIMYYFGFANKKENTITEELTKDNIGEIIVDEQEAKPKSLFENNKSLKYTSNWKDDENGKIAVLKIGEETLKDEIENVTLTKIKEISDIKSKFYMMGTDDWAALYKCTIKYINDDGIQKEVDVATILPTDNHEPYIKATFDDYTATTSFTRGFGPITENISDKIILEGQYGIENSGLIWNFKNDGTAEYSDEMTSKEGSFTINAEREVIITYTKETIWDEEMNGTKTTSIISQTEIFKYIDDNTLSKEDKEAGKIYKIIKLK